MDRAHRIVASMICWLVLPLLTQAGKGEHLRTEFQNLDRVTSFYSLAFPVIVSLVGVVVAILPAQELVVQSVRGGDIPLHGITVATVASGAMVLITSTVLFATPFWRRTARRPFSIMTFLSIINRTLFADQGTDRIGARYS